MITISDNASARISALLKNEPENSVLRVSVDGGGCSGFQYKFSFDTRIAKDDIITLKNNISVVIDALSMPFLDGSELDFVDDLMGQFFKLNNPNATASCGCGTSFSL